MYNRYTAHFFIAGTILFIVFSIFLIFFIVYMRNRLNALYMEKQQLLTSDQAGMIAEYERMQNKVAKDIHDHIIQVNFLIRFQLTSLNIKDISSRDQDALQYAIRLTGELNDEANKMCTGLNNDFIITNSLSTLIGFDMRRLCKLKDINFHYKEKGNVRLLEPLLKNILYRIAIESIENAVTHATANNIWVTVNFQDHRVSMQIKDDGCGFSPEKLHVKQTTGLPYMLQRAKFINGELTIDSKPSIGCTITLNCPG